MLYDVCYLDNGVKGLDTVHSQYQFEVAFAPVPVHSQYQFEVAFVPVPVHSQYQFEVAFAPVPCR